MRNDIVAEIWSHTIHEGAIPFYGAIQRDIPGGRVRQWPAEMSPVQKDNQDLFFTPFWFVGGRRKNETAAKLNVLFADLDNYVLEPSTQQKLSDFWPHIMWRTSDTNTQAIWYLASAYPLDVWSDFNQRLTYYLGADKGGWHASKFLRIPGTLNYKYDPPQESVVLFFDTTRPPVTVEALHALPPVPKRTPTVINAPTPINEGEWYRHLAKLWPDLPLKVRSDLLRPGARDRSMKIIATVNHMKALEIEPEDIFQALWWCGWNKWRTDRNNPQMLWDIIQRG